MQLGAPVELRTLEHGRACLRHRGPGGEGLWSHAYSRDSGTVTVALAHRRLSVLDLSDRADQPLKMERSGDVRHAEFRDTSDAALVLSYNGEVYNYVELRAELAQKGHHFHSTGDTEVLLRAYSEWGEECVQRLNGMFSFAIWDSARMKLFCARDRFGEKPFHWTLDSTGRRFAFASEIKALVAAGFARPDFDERALYRFFRYREQNGVEQTVWRDVRRLMPAHLLVVQVQRDALEVRTRRYWDTPLAPTFSGSEQEGAEIFRSVFRDSVAIRLRSDVSVGTSLSGGLDSSSVLCEIKSLGAASGQQAFTARMEDPALDEGRFVDLVLGKTGIPGHFVLPRGSTFLDRFDHLCAHQDEPFTSTSVFASYLVHELAAQHGVVVMLDGQGADEYLAGYAHYPALRLADLAARGHFRQWWTERQALKEWRGVDPVSPRAAAYHWLRARTAGRVMAVDDDVGASVLSADAHLQWGSEGPRTIPVGADALRTRLYADLTMGHLQELLRYADRNSMAWSREVRLPFLDHRLVEFCFSLPTHHLLRGAEGKRVLRRAMQGTVPNEILARRDKIGFVAPWAEWWSQSAGRQLHERLRAALRELRGLIRPEAVGHGTPAALAVLSLVQVRSSLVSLAKPSLSSSVAQMA